MTAIYFPLGETVGLVDSCLAAAAHTDSFVDTEDGRRTGPALMWAKDDGTYLLTNEKRPEGELPVIVRGRAGGPDGPVLDGTQWDLTRDICGGDDFAEYLQLLPALGDALREAAAAGHGWLVLRVKGDAFEIATRP
jgi:hypothetical protein